MLEFSKFDRRGYPTVSVREGYREWVPSYEATVEDPKVLTRPFKISFPLYRRQEPNVQLLDYECLGFQEPFVPIEELRKSVGGAS